MDIKLRIQPKKKKTEFPRKKSNKILTSKMGINGADCFLHICRVWHVWLPSHICQHEQLINLLDLKFIQ